MSSPTTTVTDERERSTRRSLLWYLSIPIMAARKLRHFVATINHQRKYIQPLWRTDSRFIALRSLGKDRVHLEEPSAYNIYQLASQSRFLDGDVAELGVYLGGTAKLLAAVFAETGKQIHLFDTFAGMPKTDASRDLHVAGDFSETSLESVRSFLQDSQGVVFYPGFFPDTALEANLDTSTFCFVHIDADIYESTKNACEFFYPRMVDGGIMVFHDFTIKSCPGVPQALGEFFAHHDEPVIFLPPNQALVVKLPARPASAAS